MFTMLRCSCSAAAFKASLKDGDTRRLRVSDFVSSNRKGAPQMSVQLRYGNRFPLTESLVIVRGEATISERRRRRAPQEE